MENKAYSYDELTTPLVSKFRRKIEKQLEKVAKVLTEALKANTVKDFAHQGTVVDRRVYVDHPTRIKAGTEIVRLAGGDPPRKSEIGGIGGGDITVVVKKYSEDNEDKKSDGS